ncbi:MAG: hypothetical protein HQM13_03515 [SAR324 cluster bacterium]|nr:hypothetical protein [SAR324 cluster bacterium]
MAKGKDNQALALTYYYGKDLNTHAKDGFLNTKVRVDRASSIPWLKREQWRGEINRISKIISQEGKANANLFSIFSKNKERISQCEDLFGYMGGRPIPEEVRSVFASNKRKLEKNVKNGEARALCVKAFLDFAKAAGCKNEQYRRALIHAHVALRHQPSEVTIKVLTLSQHEYLLSILKRIEYFQEVYSDPQATERHQQVIRNSKKEKPGKDLEIRAMPFRIDLDNSKVVVEHQINFFYTKLKKYFEEGKKETSESTEDKTKFHSREELKRLASQQAAQKKQKQEAKEGASIWTFSEIKKHQKNGFKSLSKEKKGAIYEFILKLIGDLKWFPLASNTTDELIEIVEKLTQVSGEAPKKQKKDAGEKPKKGLMDRLTDASLGKSQEKVNKMTAYLEAIIAQAEGEMRFSIHKASLIEYEQNKVGPSPPFRPDFGINVQDYHEDISKPFKKAMVQYGKITRTIAPKQYESPINFTILKDLIACVLSICSKQITPKDVVKDYLQKNEFLLRHAVTPPKNMQQVEFLRKKVTQLMVQLKIEPIK